MEPPDLSPAASPPARRGEGRRFSPGLPAVLLLAAAAAAGGWLALRSPPVAAGPAGLFDSCRDGLLAGDGAAIWRVMLPRAREEYAGFVQRMREGKEKALQDMSVEFRRRTGLSMADLGNLSPEAIFARESLAFAEEAYRGSRVYRTDALGPDDAVLHISLRGGAERTWRVRREGGAWRIDNLWQMVTSTGTVLSRPGETEPPPLPAGRHGNR